MGLEVQTGPLTKNFACARMPGSDLLDWMLPRFLVGLTGSCPAGVSGISWLSVSGVLAIVPGVLAIAPEVLATMPPGSSCSGRRSVDQEHWSSDGGEGVC